jgi:choline transport protein
MAPEKAIHTAPIEIEESRDEVRAHAAKRGTESDAHDMLRMGKTQELRRNFRFVTIFGFTMVLMATWEGQLVPSPLSLAVMQKLTL